MWNCTGTPEGLLKSIQRQYSIVVQSAVTLTTQLQIRWPNVQQIKPPMLVADSETQEQTEKYNHHLIQGTREAEHVHGGPYMYTSTRSTLHVSGGPCLLYAVSGYEPIYFKHCSYPY